MPPRDKGQTGRPLNDPAGVSERVTISLPPSLLESIDQLAEINGQSRSYVIRRALEEWMPKHQHLARAMTDPFFGGIRRRVLAMVAEAQDDPERAREVADILRNFEKKSQDMKAQKKARRHATE